MLLKSGYFDDPTTVLLMDTCRLEYLADHRTYLKALPVSFIIGIVI